MSDVVPMNDETKEETAIKTAGEIAAIVREGRAIEREQTLREIRDELRDATRIPEGAGIDMGTAREEKRGTGRVQVLGHATRHLYRNMSKEVQEYRFPEADAAYQMWFRGLAERNANLRIQAEADLERIFGRVDEIAEGVADAGGGIAAGTGGPLVPVPLEALIMINRDAVAKVRRLGTVFQMTSQSARLPTAAAFGVARVAEGSTATAAPPLFGNVLAVATKVQAKGVVTMEMLQDSAFNVVSILAARAGSGLGASEDESFCTSDGTAPEITEAIDAGTIHAITTGQITYLDIVETYFACPQQYRTNAVWTGDSLTATTLSSILDGDGRPIFIGNAVVPGVMSDDSSDGSMFRKPFFELPYDATGTNRTAAPGTLMFGAHSQYYVGDRMGITAASSEHILFENDEVMFKFTARNTGVNTDNAATVGAMVKITGITGTP